MSKRELIGKELKSKKKAFEEQETDILRQRDQGIQELEDLADRANYYLRDFAPDQALISQSLHGLERMKEAIFETAQHDRQQLEKKIGALEDRYYQEIRQLTD